MLRKSMRMNLTAVENRACIDDDIVRFPFALRDGAPKALLVAKDVLTRQLGAMQVSRTTGCSSIRWGE
jgi:hypothetical protein